jgi:hypothetical protein
MEEKQMPGAISQKENKRTPLCNPALAWWSASPHFPISFVHV